MPAHPCGEQHHRIEQSIMSRREQDGWAGLFTAAFRESRNPMVLLDSERTQVDGNGAYLKLLGFPRDQVLGRPIYEFNTGERVAPAAWQEMLRSGHATGEATLRTAEGDGVAVQWAASAETVTGRRLVLLVALSTSRWGRRFRRTPAAGAEPGRLSERERTVVRLVALGNTGPEIAEELGIAHDTVRTHVRNAMAKVDARSRAHLVAKALGNGHVLGDGAP
jgi:PAS domain S-box-containing protein